MKYIISTILPVLGVLSLCSFVPDLMTAEFRLSSLQPLQVPPPILPGDPNQIPITGGWVWMLSGGLYAVKKMRARNAGNAPPAEKHFGENHSE